ncbi:hypothetical protein [Roseivirga misakiensis]|uniref:Outer membrane porin, OprD family n=1 Tax=Roseivirga misakiensis TaxID=1563681 RepID=A0A1E5SXY5_9BACT|nr:hypothetical protein [Roseivirga misakiensis]OEK03988.1 hypothetical protein BFP71_10850 [Roseivirga misakiensis]
MDTFNKGDLEDFSGTVAHAYLRYNYDVKDWLTLGAQGNTLFHFGIDNITKRDALTGSGPIYEANLWHPNYLSGSSSFALPQLYARFNLSKHQITVGRFLIETPSINSEPWPFPNAVQGLWYKYEASSGLKVQLGAIHEISPRFTGEFASIGETIGLIAVGLDENGNAAGYPGNVNSNFLGIANAELQVTDQLALKFWNYYADNVYNTTLIEPELTFEGGYSLKAMFIHQFKVGEGGNINPALSFLPDGHKASAFGLRLEKRKDQNLFQFNFSRIGASGRMLLPREWGLEPFYTFQRRTRVEGLSDVTSFMVKWQREFESEKRDMRFFTSIGTNRLNDPAEFVTNKLGVPSHIHWDTSIKYSPKTKGLNGLSLEWYLAYRFLDDDIGGNEAYRINRVDFFHSDILLTFTF